MRKILLLLVVILMIAMAGCAKKADLVITNANVWTVNDAQPKAQAVAIRGDKILAVGSEEAMLAYQQNKTRVIDVDGRLVLPGFNDAHLHFRSGGASLMQVSLLGCQTPKEVQDRIAAKIAELPQGAWITGRGWDHTVFNNGRWPTKDLLDEVAPDNPVLVRRVDGHVSWANSKALELAGVTKDTQSPSGGEIVKDSRSGEPTGILKESAAGLVSRHVPDQSAEENRIAIEKALQEARRLGITSIQDNSGVSSVMLYDEFKDNDELTVRITEWVNFMYAENPDTLLAVHKKYKKYIDEKFIRFGLLKGFVDGTLGSRTAYFFDDYADEAGTVGLPQISEEKLTQMICTADSLNFQVGLHCIGSKANWMALNGYEEAYNRFGIRDRRHRLEHAQVIRLIDLPRLAELKVVASMQPTHCTSDMRWAEQRIGRDRCKGAYAWRSILDTGAKISFGTDWPVEPLDPMRGLYSAVTRQSCETGEPEGGWFPGQRLTMAEAIKLYTLDAAYGEFQEEVKGSLQPGKYADFIVLSKDLFTIQPEEILDTKVVMTVVGGKIVYTTL